MNICNKDKGSIVLIKHLQENNDCRSTCNRESLTITILDNRAQTEIAIT